MDTANSQADNTRGDDWLDAVGDHRKQPPELDPRDGYRGRHVLAHDAACAQLTLRLGGELRTVYEVRHIHGGQISKVAEAGGKASRDALLLAAVARYFNSGGELRDMQRMLQAIVAEDLPTIRLKEDWPLLFTQADTDQVVHVFYDPNSPAAVVFVEDEFVERTTLEALDHGLPS